nr:type II toxin-antitoxin system VapC family toxin [Halomonas cerina]
MDTNYILGLLKASSRVTEDAASRSLLTEQCTCSVITRMELLGYPGITDAEAQLIRQKLSKLTVWPLSEAIEERTIRLRQTRKIKLPDAIIAATATEYRLELLTFDQKLTAVMATIAKR